MLLLFAFLFFSGISYDVTSSYLFHITNNGGNFEPFQFGVDRVQSPDEVFQEKLKGLGQAEHRFAGNHEGGHLFAPVVDNFTLVGGRVVGGHRHRRRAVPKGPRKRGVLVRATVVVVVVVLSVVSHRSMNLCMLAAKSSLRPATAAPARAAKSRGYPGGRKGDPWWPSIEAMDTMEDMAAEGTSEEGLRRGGGDER